jgi:hypothetical protein
METTFRNFVIKSRIKFVYYSYKSMLIILHNMKIKIIMIIEYQRLISLVFNDKIAVNYNCSVSGIC